MSSRLQDLVAIVTGGSQGFGAGIVQRFLEEGASVVCFDLQNIESKSTSKQLLTFQGDVTKEADWKEATEAAHKRFNKYPTIVVNNAGWTYSQKPSLDVTDEEFDKVFEINVKAIFLSHRVLIPLMKKSGGGSFISISSTAALRPRPKLTWYNATKAAVSTASKAMALEHASDNIRFNCVCPVAGNTPLLSKFAGALNSSDSLTEEQLRVFNASVPLGRLSEPSDIANATLFFADPASSFITGTDLPVDGGRCV